MPVKLLSDELITPFEALINLSASPVGVTDSIHSAVTGATQLQNVAATLGVIETFVSSAVKLVPGVGAAVGVLEIGANLIVAFDEYNDYGTVNVSTINSIGSGLAAILASGVFATAGAVSLPVFAGLAVAVVTFSAMSIAYGDETYQVREMVTELTETLQSAIEGVEGFSDYAMDMALENFNKFVEGAGETVSDFAEAAGGLLKGLIVDGLRAAGEVFDSINSIPWRDFVDLLGPSADSPGQGLGPLLDQLAKAFDPPFAMPSNVGSPFSGLANFPQRADPFTLDLNGNGFDVVGIDAGNPVHFDLNADGVKTVTGWVLPSDGLLVLDRNSNGTIDDGKELFGDSTPLPSGGTAIDGFHALEQEDTNLDGIVNNLDMSWSELKVWRDLNQDGISQSNELSSLASLSIIAINVEKQSHHAQLQNGNVIADKGTFIWGDGSVGASGSVGTLADINLVQNGFYSTFSTEIPITQSARNLPNIKGSGGVRDLREAASLSVALLSLMEQFEVASTEDRLLMMDPIIKAWADTSTMFTTFTGAYANQNLTVDMQAWLGGPGYNEGGEDYIATAEKLTIVERFNGSTYQPVPTNAGNVTLTLWHVSQGLLDESYEALKVAIYENILEGYRFESLINPLLSKIKIVNISGVAQFDFSEVIAELDIQYLNNSKDGISGLITISKYIYGLFPSGGSFVEEKIAEYLANHSLTQQMTIDLVGEHIFIKGLSNFPPTGSDFSDVVLGGSQGDSITGGSGDDLLFGFNGNDTLNGENGNDNLFGGEGNDRLIGGANDDTYSFNSGNGMDAIEENDATSFNLDSIILTDRNQEVVQLRRSFNTSGSVGSDLIIGFIGSTDEITVLNHFAEQRYRIERIVFSDNTMWGTEELENVQLLPDIPIAFGTSGAEVFDLRKQIDTLVYGYTSSGVDSGDDTYIFGTGAGQDSVWDYGEGINTDTVRIKGLTSDQVILQRIANQSGSMDLLIKVVGQADTLTILDQFHNSGIYAIEQIQFDDDTIWNSEVIATAAITPVSVGTYMGTSGADSFDLRHSSNATIYGYISSGVNSGDDTYIFGAGSGLDSVWDYGEGTNTDTIRINGLTSDQVTLQRAANQSGSMNLLIKVVGQADTLTIPDQFHNSGDYAIEQIQFDDGTIWNSEVIATAAITPVSGGTYMGTPGADSFDLRHSTNATIYGYISSGVNSGDDTYIFGAGSGLDSVWDYGEGTNTDTVRIKGLTSDQVTLQRAANQSGSMNLLIKVVGETGALTILDQFHNSGDYAIEQIQFDDGTIWNSEVIATAAITPVSGGPYMGTPGADSFDLRHSTNATIYGYISSGVNSGDDTYIFGAGGGQDSVWDYGEGTNTDTIRIKGLTSDQVMLQRAANQSGSMNLLIKVVGQADTLTIPDQFHNSGDYAIEEIEFDDGTIWNSTMISKAAITPTTTAAVSGTSVDDFFDLRSIANSTVYGYSSSSSESGNDTYIFGMSSGKDKVQDYGSATQSLDTVRIVGVLPSQVEIYRKATASGSTDLIIGIESSTDYLTVLNQFVSGGNYAIEQIEFDDGSIWGLDRIMQAPITPINTTAAWGTAGNDFFDLRSSTTNTVYGNNYTSAESGNDTYIFGPGSGIDNIQDYGNTPNDLDSVRIVGLMPSQVRISRKATASGSTDLIIGTESSTDYLTVLNQFSSGGDYAIEQIEFDDGTIWNSTLISKAAITPTTTAAASGTSADDFFDLRSVANSTVSGHSSSTSESGNDTYIFGAGSGKDNVQDYGSATQSLDSVRIAGLLPSQVGIYRKATASGSVDLIIGTDSATDYLTVLNQFSSGGYYAIEQIEFDDGTIWNSTILSQAAIVPTTTTAAWGTAANDYYDLRHSSNNTVYGYSSSSSESGNDTYIFGAGAGKDKIQDYGTSPSNVDTLRLIAVNLEEITISRSSNNLVVSLNNTIDMLTVLNHFLSTDYRIEQVYSDASNFQIEAKLLDMASLLGQVRGSFLKHVKEIGYQEIRYGTSGADMITTGNISSLIVGGSEGDTLTGGQANDILSGGSGSDILTGNPGDDTFILNSISAQDIDSIMDFIPNEDAIGLDKSIFISLVNAANFLHSDNFISGAGFQSGMDSDDYVIYDSATGNLFYDLDGSGADSAVHVLSLIGAPLITSADFSIY